MLQELRRRETLSADVDNLGNLFHCIDDAHILVEGDSILTVVAPFYRLAHLDGATILPGMAEQHFYECGLSRAVVSNDSKLFVTGKIIIKIFYNHSITEGLVERTHFEDFLANVARICAQRDARVATQSRSLLFKFVEGVDSVFCLRRACLRLAAHPVELFAHEVAGAQHFGLGIFETLVAFAQKIAIISFVAVDAPVVNLNNLVAHAVKEIAVVSNHQQTAAETRKILLEPLDHFCVKVVSRLVENHKVGLFEKNRGECHALHLPTRKSLNCLVEIGDFQFREHLLHLCLKVPRREAVHLFEGRMKLALIATLRGALVARNYRCFLAVALQTSVENLCTRLEARLLLKIAHLQVFAKDNGATVVIFAAGNNLEQRTFTLSVAGNESYSLVAFYRERYIFKKNEGTETFAQSLNLQVNSHKNLFIAREDTKKRVALQANRTTLL